VSNRRRPKQPSLLNGGTPVPSSLPLRLRHIEWTDEPAADYKQTTLEWIADKYREQNRLNAWRCEECDFPFLAFDRHPGATPMMVSHRAFEPDTDCTGMCASVFYNREGIYRAAIDLGQGGQQIRPSHEWYRPSAAELRRAEPAVRHHVAQGGLLVREVTA
jgi:hypothetical protein